MANFNFPFEFRALRDFQLLGHTQNTHGANYLPVHFPVWHNPANPLAKMVDVHEHVGNHLSQVPFSARTNK